MFGSISRSIELFRTSWSILMEDKKLLVFPILTGIALLLMIAVLIVPLFIGAFAETVIPGGALVMYATLLLAYLAFYFIIFFFNTALISCAAARLSGRNMTIGEGISTALSHIPAILGWALVSATVGLILSLISQRAGVIGKIVVSLVGFAWNVGTYFVIPVLIFEGRGVVDAIRDSTSLIRKTWGESIIGFESVSLVMGVLTMIVIFGLFGVFVLGSSLHLETVLMYSLIALGIGLCILLGIITAAMQGIYVTALYIYARTGTVPSAFRQDLIRNASRQQS